MDAEIRRGASTTLDSDRWIQGDHGRFWGVCGAAGMLIQNQRSEVLLQLRASWCHHGGTWGIPGGARHVGEPPIEAALRETDEEHGLPLSEVSIWGSHTLDYGYWSYVTVLASFEGDWLPRLRTPEADLVYWAPVDEVAQLQLHPGFNASWTQLRQLLVDRDQLERS
jgi:8-oxo-dGTP diphosphatase